uniref:Uncharacterized protein n=1 Tax=Zeugodacus cucurbitae TaxID=28588 RepID=A0A0A1X3S5_ZEUCU
MAHPDHPAHLDQHVPAHQDHPDHPAQLVPAQADHLDHQAQPVPDHQAHPDQHVPAHPDHQDQIVQAHQDHNHHTNQAIQENQIRIHPAICHPSQKLDISIEKEKPYKTITTTTTTNTNTGNKYEHSVDKNTYPNQIQKTNINTDRETGQKITLVGGGQKVTTSTFEQTPGVYTGQKVTTQKETNVYGQIPGYPVGQKVVEKVTTTTATKQNVPSYPTGQRVVEKVTTTTTNTNRNDGYKPSPPTSGQKNVVTNTITNYQTPRPAYPTTEINNERLCSCNADRTHSTQQQQTTIGTQQSTTSSFGKPTSDSKLYNQQQFTTQTTTASGGQTIFGGITNSMSLLQQLPVFPQAPGYAASYAPDKIPKGAVIAFMPVIILPQSAYEQCDNIANDRYQQNVDSFPLGVQPAPIPFSFSQITGGARKDQCMCPCSCTQNIPDRLHKKRETNASEGLNATVAVDNEQVTVEEVKAIEATETNEQAETKVTDNKIVDTTAASTENVETAQQSTSAVVETAEPVALVGEATAATVTINEDVKVETESEKIEDPTASVVVEEKKD